MNSRPNETLPTLPITVVILTKNEEETVADAIVSAGSAFADIIVLDSFSDDNTEEVAVRSGANVIKNAFKGYASQRNFALKTMKKKTEWVLFLDADERIPKELTNELQEHFLNLSKDFGMLYMRRKDIFQNRWIKRSSGYPTWFGRLCHGPSVHVAREINEEYHCYRPTAKLNSHLIHFPFAKGIHHWLDRHNRYSTQEAFLSNVVEPIAAQLLLSKDPGLRRKAMKQIYMRLPFRPLMGFLYLYIIRGGFLDGLPGLRFVMLRSFYELMISIKKHELKVEKKLNPNGKNF